MALYDSTIDFLLGDEPRLDETKKMTLTALTEKTRASDYSINCAMAGSKAPGFSLPDTSGTLYNSLDMVRQGPVVLVFIRGLWCWYSHRRLKSLECIFDKIKTRGASLLAVSPQLSFSEKDMTRKNTVSFPILCDKHSKTAQDYGVAYQLPAQLKQLYQELGVCLNAYNQDDLGTLAHSSQFIINRQGVIVLAEINTDYTDMPPNHELLIALDALPAGPVSRPLK